MILKEALAKANTVAEIEVIGMVLTKDGNEEEILQAQIERCHELGIEVVEE